MAEYGPFRNTILQRLDPDVLRRLDVKPRRMAVKRDMEVPGQPIKRLYFLETGIASMTVTLDDGSETEAGLYGYESVVGASALVGTLLSLNHVYMQSDGTAYSCTLEAAQREFRTMGAFHNLALRFLQAQFIQTAQTAACNARHSVDQRLARWLLLTHDRLGTGVMQLTHEFLGHMLGVRRTSIQAAMDHFRALGLISATRGRITVLNQSELQKHSCGCYQVVRQHLNSYADVAQDAG